MVSSIRVPGKSIMPRGFGCRAVRVAWLCLSVLLLWMPSASALTISMTDVGAVPMTAQQLAAFTQAADKWENLYNDPITVNINISFEALSAGILGSTRTARTTHSYSAVRSALLADTSSSTEQAVINSLPVSSIQVTDIGGTRTENMVTMSTANAKAIGLGTGLDTTYMNPPMGVDAEIRFSTAYASTFDYDPSDGIAFGKRDFVGVAAHEIGHALGFFSVTDMQDNNPTFTLHPNVLDLYRFAETGGSHSLNTSIRKVVNGGAEYYDTDLTNVPLSHGVLDATDAACNSIAGSCQASHWSDDQANLMDPSLAPGVLQDIESDDIHALDYCGYNRRLFILSPVIIRLIVVRWFHPWWLEELPGINEGFEDFMAPPPPDIIKLPQSANLVFRAGFDLGYEGGEKRAGLGYAIFLEDQPIQPVVVEPLEPVKEEEYLDPPGEPAQYIPKNLSLLFVQSDLEGVPFTFQSACGETGCPYDSSLGQFGGYRVPGFLDGEGDQQIGDVDAQITIILLASDQSGEPQPDFQNYFMNDADNRDGNIVVHDPAAIGMVLPPECGDASHPRLPADLTGNCIVDLDDFGLFAIDWLACTAPICP